MHLCCFFCFVFLVKTVAIYALLVFSVYNFCPIYPSQRQNLLPTFEIITQYTPSQWKFCGNFWRLWIFFWKISNYNFQSRRQIMIIRGVYSQKMTKYDGELSKKDENFHKKGGNYTKMTEISARVTCYNAFNIVMDLLGVQPGNLRGC